ncbi:ATP-binding protein [Lutibacter citreus]|uniref:ATP-binding protein n=1 Tax=Lutibacter citreus TaxID=2138210 RepID=UPI000DBE11DE|nr:tetratricopeptide repeat-containing sensor histidine kinase [Lutibacter citreus]
MKTSIPLVVFIIYCLTILCFSNINAQEQHDIDSIRNLNSLEKNQKKLVENNNKLAYLFGGINIDSSLFYSNKAMQIAKDIKYRKELAVSYSFTARGMIEKGNVNVALENFDAALELFKEEKDTVNILDCYKGMAYVASYGSSQLKSLDYNLKALNYAEHLKDTVSMAIIYNNIGSIYKKLDNYNFSLLYFNKSLKLELLKQKRTVSGLAILYSNIGVVKVENNKFKEAEEDYKNVKKLLPSVDSEYLQSYLYLSLSGYYIGIKDFKLAKNYIDSAAVISEEKNIRQIKSRVYRKQAEWYFYQNLFKESIKYFDKCLSYSKSINVHEEFPEIYKKRAEAYVNTGLYKKAFYSLQKANTSIDSLKNNSVASFLSDFDDQKRTNEIEKLKLEQTLKNQQLENAATKKKELISRTIIIILILLVIIGVVMYYFLKVRKKNKILKQQHATIISQKLLLETNIKKLEESEKKLQKLNATKDKFFSIIAHDLKSPFNSIFGFSKLLSNNYKLYSDEKRIQMIQNIENVSESTFNLLENLLNWARSQRGFIDIKREELNLKDLIDNSIIAYLGSASIKKIKVNNHIDKNIEVCVDNDTMKIAFSNLFNNAIKFSSIGGEILLTSKLNKNNVEVCFQDFGIGMDKSIIDDLFKVEKNVSRNGTSNEKGTGLGLILCYEFITKNKSKIWVESIEGEGSKFYVSLPLKCE